MLTVVAAYTSEPPFQIAAIQELADDLRDDRAQDAVAGLVAFLVDIQERIEVSRRTVARDLDFLRDQGRVKGIGVRLSF